MRPFRAAVIYALAPASLAQAPPDDIRPKGTTQINGAKFIDWHNSQSGVSWVAGKNVFFEGWTFNDARVLLGTALSETSEHEDPRPYVPTVPVNGSVPLEFDARTQWEGLIHPIRDQQQCGSCWAFSAAEVLSDRVAVANNAPSPVLSPEDLVSCDTSDMGCSGGRLPDAWSYIKNTGLLTDSCFPYTAGSGHAPSCETSCVDGERFTRTKADTVYPIYGITNMQIDLISHGPFQVAFMVYPSFMHYKSGVYKKHTWEVLPEGGHAVKIIGWGTESGEDYWLVANSWNTSWGIDGFFKIARGINECGIERSGPPYAGLPKVESVLV